MNVPSFEFLLMALVAAVAFHLWSARWWRQSVWLVVNLGFFATFLPGNPLAVLPFAGFLLLGYVGLHRMSNRIVGWLIVLAIIAAFFWLKKYSFVPGPLLLGFPYVTIGLSYVFFRVLHLAIDTQQQSLPERPGLLSYLNYTLNFTSLVSGPIQRYEDYHAMEQAPASLGPVSLGISTERIIIGFFKVFVVSAGLSSLQNYLLDSLGPDQIFTERLATGAAIIAVYPVYLYFNFSGYTDFVIGVARWFGLILPENFNRAFQAADFITFWTRWHMTLSTWLKTYVYQPLLISLMGRFPARRYESALVVFALFVTFFLVGAWHGQTSAFLFYGVLQGLGISLNKLYQLGMAKRLGKKQYRTLTANPLYRACARGLTFTWFSFTLLWFWSDWHQMGQFATRVGADVAVLVWPALFIVSTIVLAVWVSVFDFVLSISWARQPIVRSRYTRMMWNTALVTIVTGVILLLNLPSPPIVYKNF
jgi:D-alanyl-lipoteichoic acid acyltransferase DltB (MBOAT superfamily)